jgi:uridine monophosphate synthetase
MSINNITKTCVTFGNVTLKHAGDSKVYFDMRQLIRYPEIFAETVALLTKYIGTPDVICGAGGISESLAANIALGSGIPQMIVREIVKTRGTERDIIGFSENYKHILIIDDVLTTGSTLQNIVIRIRKYTSANISILVLINRSNPPINKITVDDQIYTIDYIYDLYNFRHLFPADEIIKWNMYNKESNLCLSADLYSMSEIVRLVYEIGKHIFAIKLHPELISDFSPEIITKLANAHQLLLIADLKLADVPHIVERQIANVSSYADMVTAHPFSYIECKMPLIIIGSMSTGHSYDDEMILRLLDKSNVCGVVSQRRLKTNKLHFTPGNMAANTDIFIVGRAIYTSSSPEKSAELFNTFSKQ